jgi:cholesterol oxidase
MNDFDVVVIGSGFGGAITGCRLAEAGYKVLILERGRRWSYEEKHANAFPRELDDVDRWFWDNKNPVKHHGWIDLRVFPNMSVAQGAAVGGGSQIYANISVEAPSHAFEDRPGLRRWPEAIRKPELQPYYDAVAKEMKVRPVPEGQWSSRTRLMKEAAEAIGHGDRFRTIPLAVTFNDSLHLDMDSSSRPQRNADSIQPNEYGVLQGECYHCGNCDIGCDVNARNTLDTNYLPRAEKRGAEIRDLHVVNNIAPNSDRGYTVYYTRIDQPDRPQEKLTARLVIVSAGSLGSTELLLRCRNETGSLPGISRQLGRNWSSNGDFLTPAYYPDRESLPSPSEGPPISCVIDFLDRSEGGQSFWIQDGGFPDLLAQYAEKVPIFKQDVRIWMMLGAIQMTMTASVNPSDPAVALRRARPSSQIMPWFAQAVDAGDGRMSLRRRWWLFGKRDLFLKWNVAKSKPAIDAVVAMHKRLSDATGGTALVPPTWSISRDLITPHPLGGCGMADSPADGVVSDSGEVFGHDNLYVADGAIFPRAIGVNPSRTIGALAERIAAKIIKKGR